MNMKITSTALAALMIAGSTSFSAFAAMGNGTVLIGTKAFDFAYANDPANIGVITDAIVAGGTVYVKDFAGNWVNNATGLTVNASAIPAVTYTDADGVVTNYDAADVEHVASIEVESAVAAYEVAPLVTAENVIAAEALGVTANTSVESVTDVATKTAFKARLTTKAALVATARTTQETNAIALINNSTVYNIIARLQAPILNLQGINVAYAAEYQKARQDNFTTTKAQIQSNVIDFAKTATDVVLKADLDGLNAKITDYKNAINTTAQNKAISDMAIDLTSFNGHFALTGYTNANNNAYMTAFVKAGTLTTLVGVQTVITGVNDVATAAITAAANLSAAQISVAALFSTGTKTALNATPATTPIIINAALVKVNKLDDSVTQKAGLLADVQTAQTLFDAATVAANLTAAQTSVIGLFSNANKTALNTITPTTQIIIDAALVKVNKLSDVVTEKAGLLVDIQNAQSLFDASNITANIAAAQTSVAGLLNEDKTALNTTPATTQVLIDAALVKVNKLSDVITEKAGLLVDVQTAQTLFDAATVAANLTAAQTSVTGLFSDANKTALNTITPTTQVLINASLVKVNKLTDAVTEKAGLLVDVQTAQTLFDAATVAANLTAAQTSVDGLFVTGDKTKLNSATTQVLIDAALVKVNKLTDAVTEKAGLKADIQNAQILFDAANLVTAQTSVAGLFSDVNKTALNTVTPTTQVLIDAALAKVNKLADSVTVKAALQADVVIAQNLFNTSNEASRLLAVNNADNTADMNTALLSVGIAQDPTYVNFSSSKKLEIAELVLAARPLVGGFVDTNAVKAEITTQDVARTALIANVNTATTISAMNTALDVAQLPAFTALSSTDKVANAEKVLTALTVLKAQTPATNFTSITAIRTAVTTAIAIK